jgi:hypothetical protein
MEKIPENRLYKPEFWISIILKHDYSAILPVRAHISIEKRFKSQ